MGTFGREGPDLDPMTLARTAQRAENEYVGVMCGLMDQFAVTMGRAGTALHLDCRSLAWYPVPLPADIELVVCHSGSPRRLEASAYNARRAECARAVAAIAVREPDVTSLRDVDPGCWSAVGTSRTRLPTRAPFMSSRRTLGRRRPRRPCGAGDLEALGRLFAASHASLRDRFEVSSDALDTLVEIAAGTPGVVAARLTGAGFGGCTINLVERGRAAALQAAVEREYRPRPGLVPRVFTVDAADGAGFVPVPAAG